MSDRHDKTWMELAKLARKGERHIIGGEAADSLLRELPDENLAEEALEAIVEAVTSDRPFPEVRGARSEDVVEVDGAPETEAVQEDVLQLNRNKGKKDDAAESLVERLRREALEEEDDEA